MESQELVDRILDHVETGAVDKAVIVCLRLARTLKDPLNAVLFLRELYPDRDQLKRAFFDETRHLKKEAQEFVWKTTQDRWLEERAVQGAVGTQEDEKVLAMGVGEILREVEQMELSIRDLGLPGGMTQFDTAAFTDRSADLKGQMRLKIKACHIVLERIRTRCLVYATRVEDQLRTTESSARFLASIQTTVHNYFADRSDTVYRKLRSADGLVESADPEDHALLLTSIRRAVKAVADFVYPPVADPVVCHDGEERHLGEDQYLNRLQEFCSTQLWAGTSTRLLRSELDYLAAFVRRLNDVASKGVHAEVSAQEARQGLLGLYLFLSNLIARVQDKQEEEASEATGPVRSA